MFSSTPLKEVYQEARKQVYQELEAKPQITKLSNEDRRKLAEKLPPCVVHIISEMPAKTDKINFNKLIMLLVTYFQEAGWTQKRAFLKAQPFLEKYAYSETYNTPEKRKQHWLSEWNYLLNHPNYNFSCTFIKGLGLPGSAFECSRCIGKNQDKIAVELSEERAVITDEGKGSKEQTNKNFAFPYQVMTGAAGFFANVYSECIEAPAHFLFMAYLTCLGAFVAPKITIRSLLRTQPRSYTVLMGESATERKSTTLTKTVEHFLSVCQDFNVCWGIGSAEGLQRILKRSDSLVVERIGTMLVFDEFKTFVSKCQIETSVLLPIVNTLFESNRYETHTKKHDVKIEDAYLSLLAATTRETYERIYSPAFIHIGFTNRVFLVPGTAKRKHSIPAVISPEDEVTMKNNLKKVLNHIGEDSLELDFTPDAKGLYHNWYMNMEDSVHSKRLDTYSLRFMELLAVNNFKDVIDSEIVQHAIALCDWQFEVRKIYDPIDADSKAAVMEEKIRRYLKQGPLSDRDLKRNSNAHKAGLWFYEMAIKNLGKANEVGWDKKSKRWFLDDA